MGLVLVTPPTAPALLLSDARLHTRITFTDEDSEVQNLINAAQRYYEQVADVQLCTATYDQFWHTLPRARLELQRDMAPWSNDKLKLDRPPLQSVTWVKYYDNNNTLQTLDPSLYQVDATGQRGYLVPATGQIWPALYPGILNAFNVRFVCGFGTAAALGTIPDTILHWMREWVCRRFRDEGREGGTDQEPPGLDALFWAERSMEFV